MLNKPLGGYPAKQCPIRTHWDHSPFLLREEPTPQRQRLYSAGNLFEAEVFGSVLRALEPATCLDLSRVDQDLQAQTMDAMRDGVPVILSGMLDDDREGRTGKPDILVRVDRTDGTWGYLPIDVKHHGHFGKAPESKDQPPPPSAFGRCTTLAALAGLPRVDAWGEVEFPRHPRLRERAPGDRLDDLLQLAHYTVMLQNLGHHPGKDLRWGGIIGTSESDESHAAGEFYVAWHDLTESKHRSFSGSRAHGKYKNRSAIDRYQHEFAFRKAVAAQAAVSTAPDVVSSFAELDSVFGIKPYEIAECADCPYATRCRAAMGDHASQKIVLGRLGVRTWRSLDLYGVRTVADLARLDVPGFIKKAGAWRVEHPDTDTEHARMHIDYKDIVAGDTTKGGLVDARRRAQLIVADAAWTWIRPDDERGQPVFKRARIEIDVDFEYETRLGCYLITARIQRGVPPEAPVEYKDFYDFDLATRADGDALVLEYLTWVTDLIRQAKAEFPDDATAIRFYHWKGPENWMVRRTVHRAAPERVPEYEAYAEVLQDMGEVADKALFSVKGTSVKVIGKALGFAWHAADAGGANSLLMFDKARTSDLATAQEARDWLRTYNQDDVDVMAHIRGWLSEEKIPPYAAVEGVIPDTEEYEEE